MSGTKKRPAVILFKEEIIVYRSASLTAEDADKLLFHAKPDTELAVTDSVSPGPVSVLSNVISILEQAYV